MKTFEVTDFDIKEGIRVNADPFPHIRLGYGGNKRVTRVPLGKRDAERIMDGEAIVKDVDILKTRDSGRYLIVAPRNEDNRVLVLWHAISGYRGRAEITAPNGATVIAYDHSLHSPRGSLGETAEMLAILSPGQCLMAQVTGRRVEDPVMTLRYDGERITVTTPEKELVNCEQPEGEII